MRPDQGKSLKLGASGQAKAENRQVVPCQKPPAGYVIQTNGRDAQLKLKP